MLNREAVVEALSGIMEPDLGKDIVSLELIEGLEVTENKVTATVKSSNPAMHARKRMQEAVEFAIERKFGAEVDTEINVVPLAADEHLLP